MEKFLKIIENLAPIMAAYPRWAQLLFVVTTGLVLSSIGVFLVLFPSAKRIIDAGKEEGKSTSHFTIMVPQAGAFITSQQLTIRGSGADPKQDSSLSVKIVHVTTGAIETAQGKLVTFSDGTWRFEYVEFREAGAYDLVVDAIFGGNRSSETVRINYEPFSSAGRAAEVKSAQATPAFPDRANSFNVLVLPFEALEESRLRKTRYGRAIEKRLVELKEEQSLDYEVRYLDSEESPTGFQQAAEIGRKNNAHLVIWGDYYEAVHSDATRATVEYSLVDMAPPNVAVNGKTPITEVQSLTLISQGYLQSDIDYILFWVPALAKFSMKKYAEALPLFIQVKDRFPGHFEGMVSLEMNAQGMSFSMNLPALQLLYNLAYCYSMTGRYDEAAPYWGAILEGGTKGASGSTMMFWDTMGIAIASGNKDAMRLCAFALINRAIGYQARRKYQAAKLDYERLTAAARESEVVRDFYNPIEPFVREKLQELQAMGEQGTGRP